MTASETFGERLRRTRIEAGFESQGKLASAVGVTTQTINYYEQGKRKPDYEVFARIADCLGVSFDYLLGRTESKVRENFDIAEEFGLSDDAVNTLRHYRQLQLKGQSDKIDFVNTLLETDYGDKLVGAFSNVIDSKFIKHYHSYQKIILPESKDSGAKKTYCETRKIVLHGGDDNGEHTKD